VATRSPEPPRLRFPPVRGSRLRDEVLAPIRRAILLGQLAVGERLIEEEIADQMAVSRVPVREALRQLELEGLVASSPHRGTVVAEVDASEVEELYFLRAELEAFAIAGALRRDAAMLRDALAPIVAAMSAVARDVDPTGLTELAEQDLAFHRAIVDLSGYRILGRIWRTMDGPVRARLHRLLNASGPGQRRLVLYTAESHQPVLDAVARGDADGAAAALRQHIIETKDLANESTKE
jgi:DNA-binding GntR family transcriptional regulator